MAWRVPPKSVRTLLRPGIYLAEVARAEEKVSKSSGAPYLNVKFMAPEWAGEEICWDMIMLGGNGINIGRAKLGALGIDLDDGAEHTADELKGRRAYISVVVEKYNGEERLRVDIDTDTSHAGYWPEGERPSGARSPGPAPVKPPEAEAIPDEDFFDPVTGQGKF